MSTLPVRIKWSWDNKVKTTDRAFMDATIDEIMKNLKQYERELTRLGTLGSLSHSLMSSSEWINDTFGFFPVLLGLCPPFSLNAIFKLARENLTQKGTKFTNVCPQGKTKSVEILFSFMDRLLGQGPTTFFAWVKVLVNHFLLFFMLSKDVEATKKKFTLKKMYM